MTREQLEKYHDITVRLKVLSTEVVTDSVTGSSDDYPFTSHPVSIHGVRRDMKAIKEVELLTRQKSEIDSYIDGVMDLRLHNILDWKYRKGLGWNEIAARTGRSHNSEKEYLYRFFKENL